MIEKIVLVFLGSLLGMGLAGKAHEDSLKISRSSKAIVTECEAELPRNQQCKLIALPEDKEGGE